MSTLEPIAVMEQWVRDSQGAFSLPLSMDLGLEANNDKEAVPAIVTWLKQPRLPFAMRAAEIAFRAYVDFECMLGEDAEHQDMIDGQLLDAVDAGIVPAENRAAINNALGERPQQRERAAIAVAAWRLIRPTDAAIYEWYWRRVRIAMHAPGVE